VPASSFVGATATQGGWYRLGRALHRKVCQSAGAVPVWLRVDAVDGFFQSTEWPTLSWSERVDGVAARLRYFAGVDAGHVAGLVLSSGSAVALNADDPAVENKTVHTKHGTGLRRLLADHVARETVVIPLRDDATTEQNEWAVAYSSEADWLRRDIAEKGFPGWKTSARELLSLAPKKLNTTNLSVLRAEVVVDGLECRPALWSAVGTSLAIRRGRVGSAGVA